MTRLVKQIKLLEQQIALEKIQLQDDLDELKEKLTAKPALLKGFLWGLSLGFLVIAPKLKHKQPIKKSLKMPKGKKSSLERILLLALPGVLRFL